MDIEIRPIHDDETEEFVYINAYAFDRERDPKAIEEAAALERELYPRESTLAAFLDGGMTARLHILPFSMFLNGRPVPTGGIGGVAVLPEYRRHGFTAALLQRALNDMHDRGQAISALYPLHYELYRRYGWEVVSDSIRHSFHPKRTHVVRAAAGGCRRATPDEWPALDAVYKEYAQSHNGSLERDEVWWREAVLGGARTPRDVAVWETNGAIKGYVVYHARHFPVPERYYPMSVIQLRELIALDGDSYAGLLSYMLSHDLHDGIDWTAPRQEPLLYLLHDLSKVKMETGWPRIALRLVDVPRALEARPCLPAAEGSGLTIQVRDAFAPWNEGVWRMEVAGGRLRAEPASGAPDLALEVGALAAIFAGSLPVREAARVGLVNVSGEPALEAASSIFAVSSPLHCLDWF